MVIRVLVVPDHLDLSSFDEVLLNELGVAVRWEVIIGGREFFEVTKAFHNALQGGDYEARPENFEVFLRYNEENRKRLNLDAEIVEIHDPQPVALVSGRSHERAHWMWRCHLDLSRPNPAVWRFLETYVESYDGAIFSSPEFARGLRIPQYLFYPSIDPLSDKNRELEPDFVRRVVEGFGIDRMRPISHPDLAL